MNDEITFSQVKEFIKKHNVFPTQLWSVQELIGVPKKEGDNFIFVGGVDDRLNAYLLKNIPDLQQYESKIKELETEKQDLIKIKEEFEKTRKEKRISDFRDIVLKKAEEKKISDKLKKFLTKKLEKYSNEVSDFEKDSEEFIKSSSDEFNELFSELSELKTNQPHQESELSGNKSNFDDQF